MKKFKFWAIAVVVLMVAASTLAFAACTDPEDNDPPGVKTYTFEAEGVDLSGLHSFGYSINYNETDLIIGKTTPGFSTTVANSLSNGYCVAYLNTHDEEGISLKFNITADVASTDNVLILRLGTEYGTLNITPNDMDIIVNGTALQYDTINVVGENLTSVTQWHGYAVPFADYTVSAKFDLKAGENTIVLKVKENSLGFADDNMLNSVGPGVDCIKIKSTSTLTWESLWEDNKLEAGL